MRMTDTQYGVVQYLAQQGSSAAEISRELKIDERVVRYWLPKQCPSRRKLARKPKKPPPKSSPLNRRRRLVEQLSVKTVVMEGERFTPKRKLRRVRKSVRLEFASPARIARELGRTHNTPCSASTVRRDLLSLGKKATRRRKGPLLSDADKRRRVEYCKRMRGGSYLFSDECIIDSNDHSNRWQWVKKGAATLTLETEQGPPTVLVWGVVGKGFRHLAVLTRQNLDAEKYNSLLLAPVIPKLKRYVRSHPGAMFQQDNARPHVRSGELLRKAKVPFVEDWPPRSPDLSPIETCWQWLKEAVSRRAPWGPEQLQQFLMEEWESWDQARIDAVVGSFDERCGKCIRARGEVIKP